ncbi:MAG: response regulator transcription factor [Myxococcota bacterium]|nr:response regulator transcription factor [Myxococcota bacterium]
MRHQHEGEPMIRLLLVEDHALVRDGLKSLLSAESDIEVVGEADNGEDAIDLARQFVPDIVLMDIGMQGLNGVEATRELTKAGLPLRVLALSMHADVRYVSRMLLAGARGYLLKDSAFEELIDGIRAVMANKLFLSSEITEVVVADYLQHLEKQSDVSTPSRLTARQSEVLKLMVEGESNKAIAEHLDVSVKTVESHRQQIMAKLGVRNTAELTKYAIREGLTSL